MPKYHGKESSGKGQSSQPTVEVVTIPHVTSDVAPFLIDAIKAQKKLVSIQIKLSRKEKDYGDLQLKESCADVDEKDATGDIMKRMDASRQIEDKVSNPLFSQKTIVDQSTNDLLTKLHETDSSSIGNDRDILTSIAGGCFTFILELIEESKNKTSLRNAAVCTMRSLVLDRHDCRLMFTKHIKRFVDAIGKAKTKDSMHGSNMYHARARESPVSEGTEMMEKNALRLLYDLSDTRNRHEIEPCIVIAKRYLEEQKGIDLRTGSYTRVRNNAEMIELRRIRDIAMKFSEKECSRIERILQKIDACFDILVPRFGHNSHILPSNPFSQLSKQSDQESSECRHGITGLIVEDDEGDSIAWEDGDEGVDDETGNGMAQEATTDHAEAVDQTLAVMKQSRAFHDGVMDISFGKGEGLQECCVPSNVSDVNTERTKNEAIDQLKKCVASLMKRYERIEVWVDAILSADNLTDSNTSRSTQETRSTANPSSTEASSLIILPESIRSRKASTVTRLNEIKHRAAFAISNSRKIGIYKSNNSNAINDREPNPVDSPEHSTLLEPRKKSISAHKELLGLRGTLSSAAFYRSKKRKTEVRRGRVKIKVRRP